MGQLGDSLNYRWGWGRLDGTYRSLSMGDGGEIKADYYDRETGNCMGRSRVFSGTRVTLRYASHLELADYLRYAAYPLAEVGYASS